MDEMSKLRSQQISAAPFTPSKTPAGGLVQASGVMPLWGAEVHSLKELPIRPFFFAEHDLIEHLLAWCEEDRALSPEVTASLKSTTVVAASKTEAKQQ